MYLQVHSFTILVFICCNGQRNTSHTSGKVCFLVNVSLPVEALFAFPVVFVGNWTPHAHHPCAATSLVCAWDGKREGWNWNPPTLLFPEASKARQTCLAICFPFTFPFPWLRGHHAMLAVEAGLAGVSDHFYSHQNVFSLWLPCKGHTLSKEMVQYVSEW